MANVLILGATSAIAQDIARVLAARGDRLFLVGRSREKLEPLVHELKAAVAGSLLVDLDRLEENAACVAQVIRAFGRLDVAIVAHGYLGDQLASEADWAEAERILTTNFLSPISLIMPLANHFERERAGKLVVLSSVAGERGRPRNYTYGAAKGGVTLYLQGVRSRLYAAGVQVTAVKLGPVDTPMTVGHEKNATFVSSQRAAADIVAAMDAGKDEPHVPWFWWTIMGVVKTLPEPLFQKVKAFSAR
jgi:decaprenylphospho-beta-D-erythro-pentofuranosid-2-ulose 2-reductase